MNKELLVQTEIARILECDIGEIDLSRSLGELGFDSVNYVKLIGFMEKQFGVKVRPEILFEHSSVLETIVYVTQLSEGSQFEKTIVKVQNEEVQTKDSQYSVKDVAIIGASVRLPGASNLEELWSLISQGNSEISLFPAGRVLYSDAKSSEFGFLSGGFIKDVDAFDAEFFGISPREALLMDPQQRISMEAAWHAFEDAGYALDRLSASNTAVFVGASGFDYYEVLHQAQMTHATHAASGLSHSIIANRISQFFNLKGESEAIDAACASSLVALMRAVAVIRKGESRLALAGGVNVLATQTAFKVFSDAGMLSRDGVCRPFDDGANGYVRGEGAAFVVLKDAQAAVDDGDRILAVIKGGSVQHGGRAQSLTSPNPEAQACVIIAAIQDAGISPSSIGYIEAHGTGTTLGDPIEAKGLQKAFASLNRGQKNDRPIYIGSIKSQIGHLEAAAGIAGLLKVVACLNHREIPGNPYLQKINRHIEFSNDFLIPSAPLPWTAGDLENPRPLCGSVSSFGFGGTNAHVVVEQALSLPRVSKVNVEERVFLFSAKTTESLHVLCDHLLSHLLNSRFNLDEEEQTYLENLSFTLMNGRTSLSVRFAIVASSLAELVSGLKQFPQNSKQEIHVENKSQLSKFVNLWLSGSSIDWRQEVPEIKGHLVSLPIYPFARNRFWAPLNAVVPMKGTLDIETLVINEIADISSYPIHRIRQDMRLIADLGFDSLMLFGFVSQVSQYHDAAERILPGLVFLDVKISELIAGLKENGSLKKNQPTVAQKVSATTAVVKSYETSIEMFPEVLDLETRFSMAQDLGIAPTYFSVNDGISNNMTTIDGVKLSNYSSYNYLGLSGNPEVIADTVEAIEKYGTSVSASRILSGEKVLHKELEKNIANFMGCEDALVFVGGHATNVSVIGHLVGPEDIILYDSLAHDSILRGAIQSGARRRSFPHNDMDALDAILQEVRPTARRILIAAEGVYSMDGDIVPLKRLIEIKKKHGALLFLDEAHSLGVIGATGRGAGELFEVQRSDVDLWMGSLSKSFASCGGFIAGTAKVIHYLKYTTPGFIFSAGITPPNAASALSAIKKIMAEPERVQILQSRSCYFIKQCQDRGIDVGLSGGSAIIPIIIGDSFKCMQLKSKLRLRGVNVDPIVYPAVPEHLARLRFFLTALHSEEQIRETVSALHEEMQGQSFLNK